MGKTGTQSLGSNFTFVTPDSAMGLVNEEKYCVAHCPPPDVLTDVDAYETCYTACKEKHARGFQIAACNDTADGTKYLYASMQETTRGQLYLTDDPRRASYFFLFDVRATPFHPADRPARGLLTRSHPRTLPRTQLDCTPHPAAPPPPRLHRTRRPRTRCPTKRRRTLCATST